MTVRALGNAFASQLHQRSLKARGFKKSGHSFQIERPTYVEMLQVQGSDWNSGQEPWLLYVNILVCFKDLPSHGVKQELGKYQASGRLDRIVEDSPPQFELTAENIAEMVTLVASLSEKATQRLPEILPPIYERACRGLYSPLPLPSTWLAQEQPSAPVAT